jgi:hypothetical protein
MFNGNGLNGATCTSEAIIFLLLTPHDYKCII